MYLTSLVLYVVYSIRWLHCKAWLHVCYRSSSSVALYVHQHMIWSQSKFNLCYLHQTSLHNFLCHKHAIIPQKRFHFHFLGHKHVQTIFSIWLLNSQAVQIEFWLISIRLLNSQAVQIEFTDNICSLEESNRKRTLAQVETPNEHENWYLCTYPAKPNVDDLLIIPQAYFVSSRIGGWVSPSPEQAAKHIFNTHGIAWWTHWQFRFSREIIQLRNRVMSCTP